MTLVPYLKTAGEIKTKPTQHSVGRLREIGIFPDIILCRTEKNLTKEAKNKISLFCNVEKEAVVPALDVESIYVIPLIFKDGGLDELIVDKLNVKTQDRDLQEWGKTVENSRKSTDTVKVAVVGKHITLQDAYKSIYEALNHSAIAHRINLEVIKFESEEIEIDKVQEQLKGPTGILVPGGFGGRGIEGKIKVIQYARENNIPGIMLRDANCCN